MTDRRQTDGQTIAYVSSRSLKTKTTGTTSGDLQVAMHRNCQLFSKRDFQVEMYEKCLAFCPDLITKGEG